ncbi:MAG: isoprenylcysteine carboxylmethyltransferase family protein [Bacteroidales bacterium]|nr:isoprenylcysteine carboxylmethyltransferase family protein [Bacteroidales bacterium]
MSFFEIVVLILGTLSLIYISWIGSLKPKRYHGIYRFFSFESIFILVLLNYPVWFKDPLSLNQIISWILLLSSIFCAFFGFYLLYEKGKPEGQIENTANLVTSGMYKYIRHPLYLSLMLVGFGILLKNIGFTQIILASINIVFLVFTAKVEEKEMIKKFGNEYLDYMKKTKMFFPYIF